MWSRTPHQASSYPRWKLNPTDSPPSFFPSQGLSLRQLVKERFILEAEALDWSPHLWAEGSSTSDSTSQFLICKRQGNSYHRTTRKLNGMIFCESVVESTSVFYLMNQQGMSILKMTRTIPNFLPKDLIPFLYVLCVLKTKQNLLYKESLNSRARVYPLKTFKLFKKENL